MNDLQIILIDNQKYVLPEHFKTFEELKTYFATEFGILVKRFYIEDCLIANSEKTSQNYTLKLTGLSDGHKYTKNGHGLRCESCRKNLSKISWKCYHDAKCKLKIARTKKNEQSTSNELTSFENKNETIEIENPLPISIDITHFNEIYQKNKTTFLPNDSFLNTKSKYTFFKSSFNPESIIKFKCRRKHLCTKFRKQRQKNNID